uniref:Solute carrier family 66 member 3 n=1 Tax=Aotus nancymaae TaxID=37293 RepID=A0A2K5CGC0_AOTNA
VEAALLGLCNWSTLGVCAALKLPQISAVLAARSARGLKSLLPPASWTRRFLVFLRYQYVILLLCIFHFNGNVKQATPYVVVLGSSWFVFALQKWIIDLAMNFCTFIISAASKFAQLQCLWKTRDSGAVRIITTLMTTNDFTILIRFVIMLALNIWVTVTVLRYRKTAMKAE